MCKDADFTTEARSIVVAALRGVLTKEQAVRAHALGVELNAAVLMAISAHIAQTGAAAGGPASGAHTPSGALPPYAKPGTSKSRKKPGARKGHRGHRRPSPPAVDRVEKLPGLTCCPDCRGPVRPARRSLKRVVEDVPKDLKLEAVEWDCPEHWCPNCRKYVTPRVAAALPNATFGNGLVALTTVFHYGLGLTIDQCREIVGSQLRSTLSAGGLVDLWRRAAEVFLPWYEEIGAGARASATLHADETSWRVDGSTWWLWCFCNHEHCWYMIDGCRGSPALQRFFIEAFEGVLIHDFWAPYDSVLLQGNGDHQCCLVHLLRELDEVDLRRLPGKPPDQAAEWRAFVKMLRRLLRDSIRLRRREDFTPERYESRIRCLDRRLIAMAGAVYSDPDASRLAKRLARYQDSLFTFLDRPEADWNNNFAERQIRPAVILRKNSQCNRSERGAATQAVLMTVYRTLKLRGLDPRAVIEDALRHYSANGTLPPLPARVVANG